MAEPFLKLMRTKRVEWLMGNYPWAYLLLNLIALRACRFLPNDDGLQLGEAHIGDWSAIGATRGQYRHALKILEREKLVKVIETNRNRKKTTTGTTTEGTKVCILSSEIWDINLEDNNHRSNHRATTERPLNDHEEEVKEVKETEEKKDIAQSAKKRPRSKDPLSFDFETWKFVGITDIDKAEWGRMYPSIDLEIEILKAANWLKENPSKSNKTLWRKYLTGWLKRNNEWADNKKAYQAAKGAPAGDRRTQDIDGNPVENQYKGKF